LVRLWFVKIGYYLWVLFCIYLPFLVNLSDIYFLHINILISTADRDS